MKQAEIFGIKVSILEVTELHQNIARIIENGQKELILNVNIHCMNIAHEERWLADFLNQARIVFCDGAGVILGARILGIRIPERITYADWLWELAQLSEQLRYSMFFLGAKAGVAAKAAENLRERFPDLRIVGAHHGYFDKEGPENEKVIQLINSAKPNLLIVGFGMPLQEKWLRANYEKIHANVFLTGGACFDYISGRVRRGPRCMVDNGFEWLARLMIEPKRLWRRNLGSILFFVRIFRQAVAMWIRGVKPDVPIP
jgi:N-acetylglucosaminyldiphosphoundecaprenol N-acetyl-beta-D-mannosaminyltransferase